MFEVYYQAPEDVEREACILAQVSKGNGHLDFRELPKFSSGTITLTYVFATLEEAENMAQRLYRSSEYVEVPVSYSGELRLSTALHQTFHNSEYVTMPRTCSYKQ